MDVGGERPAMSVQGRAKRLDTPGAARRVEILHAHRAQAAVAVRVDDPPCQPHPPQPGRAEGGRPPGVLRVLGLDPHRAVFLDPAPGRPCRGEAACRAGLPRHQLPVRAAGPGEAVDAAAVPRHPALSVAREGWRGGGFLHRLGGAGRGARLLRLAGAGLRPPAQPGARGPRRPAATSRSSAMPNSTKATSTRPCSKAGSTTSAMSGG